MDRRPKGLLWIALLVSTLCVVGVLLFAFGDRDEGASGDGGPSDRISGNSVPLNKGRNGEGEPKGKRTIISELMRKLADGETGLTDEQVARYVEAKGRDARSLLVASRLNSTEARAYLDEAAEKFPDDPHVAYAMVEWARSRGEQGADIDQDAWIKRLQQSDPGNAAGYLFGARRALGEGNHQEALENLVKVESTIGANFYTDALGEGLVEAYQMSGFPGIEGEVVGTVSVGVPFLMEMDALNKDVSAALGFAVAEGDPELAEMLGRAGMAAASRVAHSNTFLVTRLVGASMERSILGQLEDLQLIPGDSKFVFERKLELDRHRDELKALVKQSGIEEFDFSDDELRTYMKITREEGEFAALKWKAEQNGGK